MTFCTLSFSLPRVATELINDADVPFTSLSLMALVDAVSSGPSPETKLSVGFVAHIIYYIVYFMCVHTHTHNMYITLICFLLSLPSAIAIKAF